MKKSTPILSMFFYVLSVVFLLCACFNFVMFYQVLSELSGSSQAAGISFNNILATYISEVGPYVAYSSLLYGVGYIIAKLNELLYTRSNELADEVSFVSEEKECVFEDVTEEALDHEEDELPEQEPIDSVSEDTNNDKEAVEI